MKKSLVSSLFFLIFLISLIFFAGCFALPVEDPVPQPPMARTLPEVRIIPTLAVARGDVVYFANILTEFVPAHEERLSFAVNGLRVTDIYVTVGDRVQAGDILAALYKPEVEEQLDAVLNREAWIRLQLDQVERQRLRALQEAEITETPVDDSPYLSQLNSLRQELALIRREYDFLHQENELRFVRASIEGVVTTRLPFTEGMVSDTSRVFATVTDQTAFLFRLRGADLSIGDQVSINVNHEPFIAEVVYRAMQDGEGDEDNEIEVYLSIIGDDIYFPVRPTGIVRIVKAEASDVMYIPTTALHQVAGREIVYTLNDLGIRKLREVEVGLIGNESVEIISGLEESELIIVG